MSAEETRKHQYKTSFRTRIRVVKWGTNKAEIIEFGGHHYRRTNEFENKDIVFDTKEESVEFSAMASALLKAMEPEGG